MAKWLERLPPKLRVVSSNPRLYIFLIEVLLFFFYFLVFPFYLYQFWSKQCANIYRKYDNTWFVMEKRSAVLFFKIYHTPHMIIIRGKIRHTAWLSSFLFQDTMFLSRWKWPCTCWPKLYKREKGHFVFWQHVWRTITLAAIDVLAVSTESQVLFSFIIKVMMDTPIFYFIIFFW